MHVWPHRKRFRACFPIDRPIRLLGTVIADGQLPDSHYERLAAIRRRHDPTSLLSRNVVGMYIVIAADATSPVTDPEKFVQSVNGEPFTGWLGLLAALSSVMDTPNEPPCV